MVGDSCTEDFDTVIQDPAKFYRNPAAVADDPQLSSAERIRLLDEWQMDISNKLAADDEGMTPSHSRDSAKDAVLIEEIAMARDRVGPSNADDAARSDSVMTKISRFWNRI